MKNLMLAVIALLCVTGCEEQTGSSRAEPLVQATDEIVSATCDQTARGANTDLYAVARFPGRTLDELARVYTVFEIPNEEQAAKFAGVGVTHSVGGPSLVGDGVVVVLCGSPEAPRYRGELLFVLPRR